MEKQVNSRMTRRMRNFDISQAERKKQLYENECGLGTTEMKIRSKYNDLELKAKMMLSDSTIPGTLAKFGGASLAVGAGSGVLSIMDLIQAGADELALFANKGYINTEEIEQVLQTIKEHAIKNSNQAAFWGNVALACIGVSTVNFSLGLITHICKEKYNEIQTEKQKPLVEDMIELDEILTMAQDLRRNDNDMSLNFIKDFLSNVNLTENTYGFNYELLSRLAKYRVAVLKEMNGENIDKKEIENRFMSIINYMYENPTLKGASSDFVSNYYVNDLIRTYTYRAQVELEEDPEYMKEQTTPRRRRRR